MAHLDSPHPITTPNAMTSIPSVQGPGTTGVQPMASHLALRTLIANGLTPANMHTAVKTAYGQGRSRILDTMTPTGDPITVDERLICVDEAGWPYRFEGLPEQGGPWWLWVHGEREYLNSPVTVAIVGTRRATVDGINIAERMARDLARAGVTVVSGMANGIDQAAHRGCLDGGGATIGVLGCGLDVDYPKWSGKLKARIINQGCLVSEQPPGIPINYAGQFLERNRIIAALADAVVVIEAKARSGALNTASWAGEYNRECLAVPASPNHPQASGSLALIRDGCQMVRHADDVLEAIGIDRSVLQLEPMPQPTLQGDVKRIYQLLHPHPTPVADLAKVSGLDFPSVMVTCGELVNRGMAVLTGEGVCLKP